MVNEVDWQTNIIKRLKKEGHYAKKWATQYNVGVPDLILSFREYGAYFTECKLEKQWLKNTSRTIQYKPKQRDEAHNLLAAGSRAFGIVIIHNGPTKVWICPTVMPKPREQFQTELQTLLRCSYDWRTKRCTIPDLFKDTPIRLSSFLSMAYERTIAPVYDV